MRAPTVKWSLALLALGCHDAPPSPPELSMA